MGYYTQYTLEARNINETDAKRLDDILNERDLIKYVFWDKYYDPGHKRVEYPSYEEQKWYDSTKDMHEISKLFPEVVFELSGEGEEEGDLWREYFVNGHVEHCAGRIVYDKPKNIDWDSLLKIS